MAAVALERVVMKKEGLQLVTVLYQVAERKPATTDDKSFERGFPYMFFQLAEAWSNMACNDGEFKAVSGSSNS